MRFGIAMTFAFALPAWTISVATLPAAADPTTSVVAPQAVPLMAPAKNASSLAGDLDLVAFGRVVAELDNFNMVPAWRNLLVRASAQDALCQSSCGSPAWRRLIAELRPLTPAAQLAAVQQRLNRLPYRDDMTNWHLIDYWATPDEFLAKGGDCEDYAIAKYFALRAAGWRSDQMRVMLSHRRGEFVGHAYLIARGGGGWLVLDNQSPFPYRPHAPIDGLWAGYSLNETSLWIHRNAAAPDFVVSSMQ
jgi:predicted transglutaminase-like cysteine proteinase